MGIGVSYQFDECEVQTFVGPPTKVPAGHYIVLEPRSGGATILVGSAQLSVSPEEWMRLKLERHARKSPGRG
jgi:hypothetical protein